MKLSDRTTHYALQSHVALGGGSGSRGERASEGRSVRSLLALDNINLLSYPISI